MTRYGLVAKLEEISRVVFGRDKNLKPNKGMEKRCTYSQNGQKLIIKYKNFEVYISCFYGQ